MTKTGAVAEAEKNVAQARQGEFTYSCENNVEVSVSGDILMVLIDLSKTRGLSSTGKTQVVGSTNGFLDIPTHPGTVLSLNVNRKVARR